MLRTTKLWPLKTVFQVFQVLTILIVVIYLYYVIHCVKKSSIAFSWSQDSSAISSSSPITQANTSDQFENILESLRWGPDDKKSWVVLESLLIVISDSRSVAMIEFYDREYTRGDPFGYLRTTLPLSERTLNASSQWLTRPTPTTLSFPT